VGSLDGKMAIITGGAGPGMGHGISRVLAREGAFVAILEVDLQSAEIVRGHIEKVVGRASALPCDVGKGAEVRSTVEKVVEAHGQLDILVNSAGVGSNRPVAEASEEEFDRLAAIDLRGMWLCCKYAIPHMRNQKSGAIVNIASVHSRGTMPRFGLYSAMKAK
jgi:hypothetical protein